jgi:uncharacterized protein YegL
MTKPNTTELVVILDRSGSMAKVVADMEGGFNQFMADQRKASGECRVTLVRFDSEYEVAYESAPVALVPPLKLEPRGSTSLLDAIGRTINDTGRRLRAMPEHERPSKVLFLIITDGEENSSTEFRRDTIAQMTQHQRDKYQWEFVYLGANQDAFKVAQGIGIFHNVVKYEQKTRGGIVSAFKTASEGFGSYHAGAASLDCDIVNQSAYDSNLAQAQKSDSE